MKSRKSREFVLVAIFLVLYTIFDTYGAIAKGIDINVYVPFVLPASLLGLLVMIAKFDQIVPARN